MDPTEYEGVPQNEVVAQRYYSERETLRLERRLARLLKRQARNVEPPANRLALLRAWMTAIVDVMAHVDDSCGSMGDLFCEVFNGYIETPWPETGIVPEVYLRDLIEFSVWEDYGLITDVDTFFRALDARHQQGVEEIFAGLTAELREHGFKYQLDAVLALRASFLAEQRLWDYFVECAAEVGSRAWRPIVQLAETAAQSDRRTLAEAVFAAPISPGFIATTSGSNPFGPSALCSSRRFIDA